MDYPRENREESVLGWTGVCSPLDTGNPSFPRLWLALIVYSGETF